MLLGEKKREIVFAMILTLYTSSISLTRTIVFRQIKLLIPVNMKISRRTLGSRLTYYHLNIEYRL